MKELEELIGLVLAAVILATAARRVGAPYPVFLALGEQDQSPVAEALRQEFAMHLGPAGADAGAGHARRRSAHRDLHRGALEAAREAIHAMRANDEIGDDAFHQIEEEFDWLEMAARGKEESTSEE
jgi:monovalent cation/hydrogen antiporter